MTPQTPEERDIFKNRALQKYESCAHNYGARKKVCRGCFERAILEAISEATLAAEKRAEKAEADNARMRAEWDHPELLKFVQEERDSLSALVAELSGVLATVQAWQGSNGPLPADISTRIAEARSTAAHAALARLKAEHFREIEEDVE